jgi:hypothetical protein
MVCAIRIVNYLIHWFTERNSKLWQIQRCAFQRPAERQLLSPLGRLGPRGQLRKFTILSDRWEMAMFNRSNRY